MNEAPITQVMMTVQFAPAIAFGPVQITDAFNEFRAEFPVFEQINRAGSMPLNPGQIILEPPFGPPRNVFRKPDNSWSLAFQEDRFTFGWLRLSPPAEATEYPGYTTVSDQALVIWERLRAKLIPLAESAPSEAVVAEILYTNVFPAGLPNSRLSSVYRFLNPEFQVSIAGYAFSWTEPAVPHGFVQINVNGPVQLPAGNHFSAMQMTSRFRVEGSWSGLRTTLDRAHDAVSKVFANAVNPEFRPT